MLASKNGIDSECVSEDEHSRMLSRFLAILSACGSVVWKFLRQCQRLLVLCADRILNACSFMVKLVVYKPGSFSFYGSFFFFFGEKF